MKNIFRRKRNEVEAFDNTKTEATDIQYSKYIASWYIAGGRLEYSSHKIQFKNWLRSLGLEEKDVEAITRIAVMGDGELEGSAWKWINEVQEEL